MLIDQYGRTLDYLRVSLTDRCNLRCLYCMPQAGVEWKSHDDILRFEETLKIVSIMAGLGIRKIKLTGGEPLVRKGAADFVRKIRELPGIEELSLTTNGLLLASFLDQAAAKSPERPLLNGINISLDAVDAETFGRISRSSRPEADLAALFSGIDKARSLGIPVKLNCVPLRGFNEKQLPDIAALAKTQVRAVRFIELMPLGLASKLKPIPGAEVKALLEERFGPLEALEKSEKLGNGPASYYALKGFKGRIGFIDAVTEGFCESCNRLRLTADGRLMPCLSSTMSVDLRSLLRNGVSGSTAGDSVASDSVIIEAIKDIASRKPRAHTFSNIYQTEQKHDTGMFRIGG